MSSNINPVFGTYKYTGSFRFWVQKVLPLVYDDSLSYYELLCKVVQYLNDVIENVDTLNGNIDALKDAFMQLQEFVNNYFDNLDVQDEVDNYFDRLIESGEITELLRNALVSTLVDNSYYKIIGQVLPQEERLFNVSKYQQGFAVGYDEVERPLLLNCFTDGTPAGETNVFVLTYYDTGVNVWRKTVPSGHCNSATFCKEKNMFYVACGGGNSSINKVIGINMNGDIRESYDFEYSPYGIAWDGTNFFVQCGEGNLIKLDINFIEVERYYVTFNEKLTYQGMFCDDVYLYYPCGNTITLTTNIPNNYFEVRYKNGTLYKYIDNHFPLETEEGDILDGKLIVANNTQNCGLIIQSDLYDYNIEGYLGYQHIDNNNANNYTIYINEEYNGFFMDNTPEHPYSSLLWNNIVYPRSVTALTISLISDVIDGHPFTEFDSSPFKVILNGNGHSIYRINFQSTNGLTVRNCIIRGQTDGESLYSTSNRLYLENITFGEENSDIVPSRLIDTTGNYEINGIIINHIASNVNFYLLGSGYFRAITLNANIDGRFIVGFFGGVDSDSTFKYLAPYIKDNYGNTNKVMWYYDGSVPLSFNQLRFPMSIDVGTNTATIEGAPKGYETNLLGVIVEMIATEKYLKTFIRRDGSILQVY